MAETPPKSSVFALMIWGAVDSKNYKLLNSLLLECSLKGIKLNFNTYVKVLHKCHTNRSPISDSILFYIQGFMEKDLTVFQRDHMMSIIYGLMEEDEHARANKETTDH